MLEVIDLTTEKLLIIFGVLSVLFIAGCVQKQGEIKEIVISGIDKIEEVYSDVPVDLIISGIRNKVTVLEGTEINSITISGVDITLILPKGSHPEIADSGIDTQIKYYD